MGFLAGAGGAGAAGTGAATAGTAAASTAAADAALTSAASDAAISGAATDAAASSTLTPAASGTAPVEISGATDKGIMNSYNDVKKYTPGRGPGSPESQPSQINLGQGAQVSSSPLQFNQLMEYLKNNRG